MKRKSRDYRIAFSSDIEGRLAGRIRDWRQGYRDCVTNHKLMVEAASTAPGEDRTAAEDEFVFLRTWYTHYLEWQRRHPEWELDWCPVPTLSKRSRPLGVAGEWYLGIIQGTVNVPWAVKLIADMTTSDVNSRLFLEGAALPTTQSIWDTGSLIDARLQSHYRRCRRRSRIDRYTEISTVLSSFCENTVLSSKSLRAADLSLAVRRLAEAVAAIEGG